MHLADWTRDGERSSLVTTAGLAALAAATRLLYWWSTADAPLLSDARHYHQIAANIADGFGFADTFPALDLHPTAFRPPVFPYALGGMYRLFGSSEGVARAFAVAIGVALVVVTFQVVRRHCGRSVGFAAAALVAVYPPLVANDTVPLTESLSLILLLVLAHLIAQRSWWQGALVCGLLILTRPSAQALVLVGAVWVLATLGWKRAVGFIGVTVLVVAPWVVRNTVEVGTPSIVTSNGFNIAAMYSDAAYAARTFIDPVVDPGFDDMRFVQFDEADWDAELRSRGLEGLRNHPSQLITVPYRNIQAYFEIDPSLNVSAEEVDGRNMGVRDRTLPIFYLVTVTGVVGLWLGRRQPFVAFMSVAAVYFTVLSLATVAPPRLRAPFDLACCLGAAITAVAVWHRWRRARAAAEQPKVITLDETPHRVSQ